MERSARGARASFCKFDGSRRGIGVKGKRDGTGMGMSIRRSCTWRVDIKEGGEECKDCKVAAEVVNPRAPPSLIPNGDGDVSAATTPLPPHLAKQYLAQNGVTSFDVSCDAPAVDHAHPRDHRTPPPSLIARA